MASSYHRDVGPIIQILRNFLRGRYWNEQLRKPKDLSPRPYPPPVMPPGSSDKISSNHFFTRDGRRMVAPPLQLTSDSAKLIAGETQPKTSGVKSPPKPGDTYNWDRPDAHY